MRLDNNRSWILDGKDSFGLADTYLQTYVFIPRGWALHDECFEYDSSIPLADIEKMDKELSLVAHSLMAIGQIYAGTEINIWKYMVDDLVKDDRLSLHHRKIIPKIFRKIQSHPDRSRIFEELYFSMVMPVAAAVDVYESDIGVEIYRNKIMELEEMYL